ncbi:MAG: HAD hydrolase family protein [Sediminibacterium sp.]|nr:HAD hydrolase family protein [Sediminibacterium sp.]MBX9781126.1 HAD hydrolase family protein [Chitinophagaceae bacterium]
MIEKIKNITCFVFDVDGVLTDGSLLVMPGGLMARRMNIKDGYALQLAVKKGYEVIIISGGDSPEVEERLYKLGIRSIHMRVTDKWELLNKLLTTKKIAANQVMFMGDDVPDLYCMQQVGLSAAPADAAIDIAAIAEYTSLYKGGEGAVRDIIEKIMRAQGTWNEDLSIRAC